MKNFLLKFLAILLVVVVTYLLGAHHIVSWSYIAAFWGVLYLAFYAFHKWWKKDWEDQKGRVKATLIAVMFLPFMGVLFNIGTAFYHGPQKVFVVQVNDISTKGMDAKVLHPYGRGFGWNNPDLPRDLKVVSDTEVQVTQEDGTKKRVLISEMFPNAETSRVINNQSNFWWKFDSTNVSEELSNAKTNAQPATIFMYGYYLPIPKFVKEWMCPRFTVSSDGKEVPATANCEWAQYNIITVHDGGPYRIMYVPFTYILILSLLCIIFKKMFRKAKSKASQLTDGLREKTGM